MATGTTTRPERRASPRPEHRTPRSAPRSGRPRARTSRARATRHGSPPPTGRTRSTCWRSRPTTRVPELVPIRYGRMLVVAVHVLPRRRGDHGGGPRRHAALGASRCSSAVTRTSRTSALFGSPERELVFDINDFDETLPGPWEWDVKRLAASLEIAGREQRVHGRGARRRSCWRRCASTARRCASSPAMRNLDVWYAHLARSRRCLPRLRAGARQEEREGGRARSSRRPRTKDSLQAFSKLTHGRRRRSRASSAIRRCSSRSTSS